MSDESKAIIAKMDSMKDDMFIFLVTESYLLQDEYEFMRLLTKFNNKIEASKIKCALLPDVYKILKDNLIVKDEDLLFELESIYSKPTCEDDLDLIRLYTEKLSDPFELIERLKRIQYDVHHVAEVLIERFKNTVGLQMLMKDLIQVKCCQEIGFIKAHFNMELLEPYIDNIISTISNQDAMDLIINETMKEITPQDMPTLCKNDLCLRYIKRKKDLITQDLFEKLKIAFYTESAQKTAKWLYKFGKEKQYRIFINLKMVLHADENNFIKLCQFYKQMCPWYYVIIKYDDIGAHIPSSHSEYGKYVSKIILKGNMKKIIKKLSLNPKDGSEMCYICKYKHSGVVKLNCGHSCCLEELFKLIELEKKDYKCLECNEYLDIIGCEMYIY